MGKKNPINWSFLKIHNLCQKASSNPSNWPFHLLYILVIIMSFQFLISGIFFQQFHSRLSQYKVCMALQPYPASLQVSLLTYFVSHQRFCLLFVCVWVFAAVHRLFSSCSKRRLLCGAVCGLLAVHLLLWSMDSRVCGLQSCRVWLAGSRVWAWQCAMQAQLLNMWELPGRGLRPVSPELVSGFLSTGLPGKPLFVHLECMVVSIASHHFPRLGDQNEVLFIILCYQTHCLHICTQISETMMLLIPLLGTFSCDLLDLHYSEDSFKGYQRQVIQQKCIVDSIVNVAFDNTASKSSS